MFALLEVLHWPTQLGRPGGAAPAPPPPHPDPFSKSPPTGCISPRSPTRLPKEVCCAVLQLETRFPSFPQRAGTGSPRANCHYKAAKRKAKRRSPGRPPNSQQYRPPKPTAPTLCRHSTASAPAGLGSKATYGGLGSTNAVFIPTSLHKIQERKREKKSRKPKTRRGSCLKTVSQGGSKANSLGDPSDQRAGAVPTGTAVGTGTARAAGEER